MTEYIERRYLSVEEVEEEEYAYASAEPRITRYWEAVAAGPLVPSKVSIYVSRTGVTATDALDALNAAIEEQGWEVHR